MLNWIVVLLSFQGHLDEHMLCYNIYVPFCTVAAFPDVQAANSMRANSPFYHQRCRLLKWVLVLFILEDTMSMFSRKEFQISTCSTTEQFSTNSILN